ncbi:MAG: septal ring lytic transglycosylase RlpA family protein [Treponema sp.]|nr:septal ring lytic transglycosylase RlpA family protein [Treponema sp.]
MKRIFFVLSLCFAVSLGFADVLMSNAEASYYAEKYHGRKTASGEIFNMNAFTCAHKTLPFGTVLRVTNLSNNKSVDVRVNDRGPFVKGREIDVSKAAAQKLGMIKTGTARVKIEILSANGNTSQIVKKSPTVTTPQKSEPLYWDVQVGSFSNYENANKIAQNLLQNGFDNVYFQKTSSVTRVVIKKIPDSALKITEAKLRSNGYADYIVKKNG